MTGSRKAALGLAETSVSDVMHKGLFTCTADAPVSSVARIMAAEHIHAVVVNGIAVDSTGDDHAWGIVSDLDVLRAAIAGSGDLTAGEVAAMEFLTVGAGESLERAAQVMAEHEVTHLIVLDPRTGHAVGVLSTHDVAGAIASEGP